MKAKQYIFFGTQGRKVLSPVQYGGRSLATSASWFKTYGDTEEERAFYGNECRILRSVSDIPNVASMKDCGELEILSDGEQARRLLAIEMPFYRGKTLDAVIAYGKRDRFELPRLLDVAKPLAGALSALEERSIVHNDIQPRNILVTASGECILIDCGNSVELPAQFDPRFVKGAPGFVSPEKREGHISVESDVYAFGKILEKMMARGVSLGVKYPASLKAVASRCTAKEASRRYHRFNDVRDALSEVEQGLQKQADDKARGKARPVVVGTFRRPVDWVVCLYRSLTTLLITASVLLCCLSVYFLVRPDDGTPVLVDGRPSLMHDCRTVWNDIHNRNSK